MKNLTIEELNLIEQLGSSEGGMKRLIWMAKKLLDLEGFEVNVGNGYFLSQGISPDRVWICKKDGEGGDFDLRELIEAHYKEHL